MGVGVKETEIYQTAMGFIVLHGTKVAWQHALAQAINQSDLSRTAAWLRVVDAIDEMTRVERRPDETVQ